MGRSQKSGMETVMEVVRKLNLYDFVFLGTVKIENGKETWETDFDTKKGDFVSKRKYINCLKIVKDGMTGYIRGLQSFNNTDFELIKLALQDIFTGENETGFNLSIDGKNKAEVMQKLNDFLKGSKTTSTKDENGHVEYAKDSYKWGQLNIIYFFQEYQEESKLYKVFDFEKDRKTSFEKLVEKKQNFLQEYYKRVNNCNASPNGWTADRLEDFYITSKILPAFIREKLQIDLQQQDLMNLQDLYMQYRDIKNKEVTFETFSDSFNRLVNDNASDTTISMLTKENQVESAKKEED